MLLLDPKQLSDLMDRTIDAQPFLGQLVADPTARGLFSALSLLGIGVTRGDADLGPYLSSLRGVPPGNGGRRFRWSSSAALVADACWAVNELSDSSRQIHASCSRSRSWTLVTLEPGGAGNRRRMRNVIAVLEFVKSG